MPLLPPLRLGLHARCKVTMDGITHQRADAPALPTRTFDYCGRSSRSASKRDPPHDAPPRPVPDEQCMVSAPRHCSPRTTAAATLIAELVREEGCVRARAEGGVGSPCGRRDVRQRCVHKRHVAILVRSYNAAVHAAHCEPSDIVASDAERARGARFNAASSRMYRDGRA